MAIILLAEDDGKIAAIYRKWLESERHEVLVAVNGLSGLRHVTLGKKPDLILTDIMMPEVDGEEMLTGLAALLGDTPAVIVTAISDTARLAAFAKAPNVKAVLRKPVGRSEVVAAIDAALGK